MSRELAHPFASHQEQQQQQQEQQPESLLPPTALDILALMANKFDVLSDLLVATGSLSAARLVCHELRDLVDSGIKSVKLTFSYTELLSLGLRSPLGKLHRWPRCRRLILERRKEKSEDDKEQVEFSNHWEDYSLCWLQAASLVQSEGLADGDLPRVEELSICANDANCYSGRQSRFDLLLSQLAIRWPDLRRLDLSGVMKNAAGVVPLPVCRLFYAALAARCRQLESLTLPLWSSLAGLEALAGTLQRLEVAIGVRRLMRAEQQSLAQLHKLRELRIEGLWLYAEGAGDMTLTEFFDGLSPSVEVVELTNKGTRRSRARDLRLRRDSGRIQVIRMRGDLRELDAMADSLLRCRDMEGQSPTLHIADVGVEPRDALPTRLGLLLERCSEVEVEAVCVELRFLGSGEDLALQAALLERLCMHMFGLVAELRLYCTDEMQPCRQNYDDRFSLNLNATEFSGAQPAPSASVGSGGGPAVAEPGAPSSGIGLPNIAATLMPATASAEDLLRAGFGLLMASEEAKRSARGASSGGPEQGAGGAQAESSSSTRTGDAAAGGGQGTGRVVLLGFKAPFSVDGMLQPKGTHAALDLLAKAAQYSSHGIVLRGLPGTRFALAQCATPCEAARFMELVAAHPAALEGIQVARLPFDDMHKAYHAGYEQLLELTWVTSAGVGLGDTRRLQRLLTLAYRIYTHFYR